jgi:hypothetical protein
MGERFRTIAVLMFAFFVLALFTSTRADWDRLPIMAVFEVLTTSEARVAKLREPEKDMSNSKN